MRPLIYILILLLLFYAPVQRLDVAKLEPVEVIFLSVRDGITVLMTDTEAWGRGESLEAALQDLHDRTPGVIYLDTAQYLLITQAALPKIDDLRPHVKGAVKLCMAEEAEITDIAKFLEIHGQLPSLKEWKQGDRMPVFRDGKIIE